MRRRIYNLAKGRFEYDRPHLVFSKDRLELQVIEGKSCKGSFTIDSENGVPMRGIVYSSNGRMECLNPQFEGLKAQIQFEFHSEGLIEGNIQKGEFYIICNRNEYNLSFVVNISRLYAESSIGKIRTLYDISRLAASNREEAYEIFTSPMFANLLKKEEGSVWMLYEGLLKPPVTMRSLEEFLIGTKQKAKILLSLEQTEAVFSDIQEPVKETILLTKNQWGYLEIEISSDADFLKPFREKITADDFIGSTAQVEYLLDEKKLHPGKNYGRIQIKSPYQTLNCTVCVHQHGQRAIRGETEEGLRRKKAEFMKYYVDFRLKKVTPGVWAKEALGLLDDMLAAVPEEHWYGLMKAQVFWANGQRQEAEWILEEKKKTVGDKNSTAWAYYLYLTTLLIREETYADKVLRQVEKIAHYHGEDLRLFWILLFLRRDYAQNSYEKYRALKEQIMDGCASPYFYIEAYLLLEKEPYILTELGDFECRILLWALRKKALTKEIAEQVMVLAGDRRHFESRIYRILCGCYEVCPDEEMLTVICAYLIKGQRYDTSCHHWYEEGIARDLRLAGLYEAFVYSMDRREVRQVPQMVQMYFRYHSSLPYEKKAALYVNIIANREDQPSVYASYERTMERFALEQIIDRHMDDNLAVIYDTFLREEMIQKEVARSLGELLFYHKLTCFDPNAVRLYVVHRQLREGFAVPLVNGTAYFPIYSSEYKIFLEDRQGNRYASSMEYQLEKLMRPGRFIRRCMEQAPECLSFFIYLLDKNPSLEEIGEEELAGLRKFLSSEKISEAYRSELCPKVIRLYQKYEIPFEDGEALLKINPSYLNQSARKYMMELFVERQDYELAYQWMQMYGFEQMEPEKLTRTASHMAQIEEYGEEEFLTYLCAAAFFSGNYDAAILSYLCRNYDGPTKALGKIWEAAKQCKADTGELEERTLIQMLYTTEYLAHAEEIFESYCRSGGKKVIQDAYVNYFSQAYFVENMVLPDAFLQYLIAREEAGQKQIEVCRLALLKYLAFHAGEQERHLKLIEGCLEELAAEGRYFAFFKRFSVKIQQKFGFEDKIFLECHNDCGGKIWLHYRVEEEQEYEKRQMQESYPGIYVCEFLLFFGESIQYYISREEDGQETILESNRISGNQIYEEEEKSRYALLNRMICGMMLEEGETVESCMREYEKKEEIVDGVFQIL